MLFGAGDVIVRAASEADRPALAAFCRTNPAYDLFLTGALPDEVAWVEDFLSDLPPAAFNPGETHKLIAVRPDEPDRILAIIDVTEDMIAPGVGHIGLFQVAERLQGTGLAHALYLGLEAWLEDRGMDVIRLGVLDGNPRGAAFWARHGYRETRTRQGVAPTGKVHLSHVLYKPLAPRGLDASRARGPRDDPASP